MLIKFSGGRASAGRAAAYLTGELDSQGEERAAVIVLRGDPELVAAVADGLEFAHTYTSGVLAWAPEDQPTAAHISAVLDEFEATAWAGLETPTATPGRPCSTTSQPGVCTSTSWPPAWIWRRAKA